MTEFDDEQSVVKIVSEVCSFYPFWKRLPDEERDDFRSKMISLVTQARRFSGISNPEILAELQVPMTDANAVGVINDSLDMLKYAVEDIPSLRAKRRAALPAGYLLQ